MNQEEVRAYQLELVHNEDPTQKFCQILEAAGKAIKAELPVAHQCEVEYWAAGPGCGKSYAIRHAYAKGEDMIIASLRILMEDYDYDKFHSFHHAQGHLDI